MGFYSYSWFQVIFINSRKVFQGSRLVFHGFRFFRILHGFKWVFMIIHGFRMVFHSPWFFQDSRLVIHCFRLVFMVINGSRLIFHGSRSGL